MPPKVMKNYDKVWKIMMWKRVGYLIIVALLAILIPAVSLVFRQLAMGVTLNNSSLERNNKDIFCSMQLESMPFDTDIELFKDLHRSLSNANGYTYYEMYTQPLFGLTIIDANNKDNIQLTLDEDEQIDCIQISENVQYDFMLKLNKGSFFTHDDFVYNGKNSIPVLLGNNYSDRYSIGDSFTSIYLFDKYNFRIIGFLDAGSIIDQLSSYIILDDFIVMPSFEVTNNVPVTDGIKIHYANKTSGKIKTTLKDYEQAHNRYISLLKNSEAGSYAWMTSSLEINYQEQLGINLYVLFYLTLLIICLFIGSAVFFARKYIDLTFAALDRKEKIAAYTLKAVPPMIIFFFSCCIYVLLAYIFRNHIIFTIGEVTLILLPNILLLLIILAIFAIKFKKFCIKT